jgi:tetratricopeptide (TPR) repeat protein
MHCKVVILGLLLAGVGQERVLAQGTAPPAIPRAADAAFFEGDWARAKQLFDEFLKANPTSGGAHVKAGYIELSLGNPAAAIAHFETVVSTSPASGAPFAEAGISMALARQGKMAESMAHLERAVATGYSNYAVLDREAAFEPLRKDPKFVALRDRAMNAASPCMGDSASRAFDFWVGEWDVYVNGTAQLAGRSRIDRVSGGCAILENWAGNTSFFAAPSDGKSLNFVDPATRKWRQVWMGSGGGLTTYEDGEYRDGALRFVYDNVTPRGRVKGRFMFFNLGPNRVRQLQESTPDEGKTWQTVYDFIYVRRGSGESPLSK